MPMARDRHHTMVPVRSRYVRAVRGGLAIGLGVLLAAPGVPAQAVPYRVLPSSVFEVSTETEGILGRFVHRHVVRADSFRVRLLYDRTAPRRSSIEVLVPAAGLRVATEADSDVRVEIRQAMLTEVLRAAEHPEIRLASSYLRDGAGGLELVAALTLVGVTRGVVVPLRLTERGDTLRVEASFTARQSHFDIEPYSKGLGTLRVADQIEFRVDAEAVPVVQGAPTTSRRMRAAERPKDFGACGLEAVHEIRPWSPTRFSALVPSQILP